MTDVYLITTASDPEGELPRGICSTFEEAVKKIKFITKWGFDETRVNIYVVTPDYDYDYELPCIWCKNLETGKMLIGKEFNG